jgi:hypothetical protein
MPAADHIFREIEAFGILVQTAPLGSGRLQLLSDEEGNMSKSTVMFSSVGWVSAAPQRFTQTPAPRGA